jgi:hypothetical protein
LTYTLSSIPSDLVYLLFYNYVKDQLQEIHVKYFSGTAGKQGEQSAVASPPFDQRFSPSLSLCLCLTLAGIWVSFLSAGLADGSALFLRERVF